MAFSYNVGIIINSFSTKQRSTVHLQRQELHETIQTTA